MLFCCLFSDEKPKPDVDSAFFFFVAFPKISSFFDFVDLSQEKQSNKNKLNFY